MIVVRIWLHIVHNVEAVDFVLDCILDAEEVPLGVAVGAVVVLKIQIVLKVVYLDSLAQIRALKPTLKYQRLVIGSRLFELVVGFEVLIVAVEARASILATHGGVFAPGGLLAGPRWLRTVARRLLQTVGQVQSVEVVALLVRLIDLPLVLLAGFG